MKKILTIVLVAFIMMQFFPIDKTNPPLNKGMDFINIKKTPAETAKIIRASCYDCHSNETRYPWYSNISPASWLLKNHIDEGRKELNFSTFSSYPAKIQAHKLQECIDMVVNKEMPLETYIVGHQEAKLTDKQRNELAAYFRKMKDDTERKIMLLK